MSFSRATNHLGASVEPSTLGTQNMHLYGLNMHACRCRDIIGNRCGNIIQKCMHHGIATYMQETVIVFIQINIIVSA